MSSNHATSEGTKKFAQNSGVNQVNFNQFQNSLHPQLVQQVLE